MDWKENKLLAVAVAILALICIGLAIFPFMKKRAQESELLEKARQWKEKENENLIIGPEGYSMGLKE